MLECRLSVVMGTGRRRNATNQRLSPLQLHLRQRIALHLHDLHVMCELHARTEYATVAVVQEGVLLRVVDEAHRAVCGRVAEVVADSGHQKVFHESPDMLSGARRGKDISGEHLLGKPCCRVVDQTFQRTLYSRACIEENFGHSLVAIRTSIKIQRCVSLIQK